MKKTAMLLITLVMVLCSALAVAAGSNAFPQPVVQAPSSVQRGEYFTVSIGEVAGVINYDLNIIDTHGSDNEDDWEWLLHTDEDGYPGTLTLSTATLAPGDYTWLAGLAGTQTREGNRTTGTFSVTASPRVGLHVSRTDMLSYENFWGNIVAPGAEGVKFYVNGNEWDSRDGEVFDATWLSFETEGDYVLGASACFGGEWTDPADTTVTVHLSSPHGDLGDPHFEIPGEIAAGTDLVIPYEAEDGTDVFFWYETLEGEWQGDGNGVDGQIVVSGLEEGGLYRIHLTAAREGYNGFVQAPSFIVNYAEEVRVDDAGSTLTMRLARGESYAFDVGGLHTTVYAPGADEVKLLYLTDEGTWEERDWFISDAWGEGYRTEIHWNEAGEYTLGASAHYADGDVWTNPQNCQITIPVLEPIGELTAPIMHGQPDSVVRGEFVTVTVDPVENATSYDLGIYGGEGDNWYELDYTPGDYREDAGTLTVSTASLPEGHYVLRAAAWAYGYVGSESLSDLRIRESDDSVHLFVDRTTALTHEDVRASIVAPGADSVRLYVDGEEREQWGGDVMDAASVSFGLPGDGILTASACFGGEWTDPEDCRVVLNITAPYGSAGAGFSMPEEIGTGEDLVISLDHMEDISAEWWLSFEGEGNSFEGDGRSDRGPYVISASDLAPRRVYRVHFSAWGQGYEDFYQEQCVMVHGAQDLRIDDQGSTLTMRIPKDTVDTYELLPITLFAPGADGVQLYRGNQEGEWELDRDFSGSTGAYIEYNWRYPDDYVLGASAYYADGDVWTDPAACQITILVVSTKGELGSPDVQMQDKAYLGDQVPIIFGATDHATDYGFWVHRSGDDEWLTGDTREGAGEFVLDTYALGIGTFFVETDVDAVGYTEGHTSLHLAVLDPDDIDLSSDDFYFTVSTTDVLTHEDVHLIAYAPGAEAIRLYTSSDSCEEQDGPGIDRWMSWGQEDEIPVSLSAFYDGEWSEKAEMCTIHVRAPYGDLPVPEVGYASLVPTNEDYIFTVRAAENVHYDVRVNWIGDWEFDLQHEEDCEGAQTFTVDSQYIDNPDHFMIRVWYWYPESMVGYNDGYLEYHFRAEDDPNFDDEKVTLTVEKDHALINEDVEITVTAQGASEIRLYNLDGEFDAAEGDTWNRTTAEEFLYARALIDGTWYTSSPVTIAREYLGECGSFAYSLGETELLRGDTLHLHIGESEHATWYDVHIMHDGEQVYYFRFEEPGDYELQVLWPDGDYCLYVSSGALGYGWYDDGEQEQGNFTITSPEDDPGRLTVSKTELITNETFSWTLYAKGADQIALCMTEDPGNLNAEENHWYEQDGDWAEGDWHRFGNVGTYYLFIGGHFANDEGGYWDYVGDPVEIHVTAPNGDVPVPEVGYASLVPANEDYIFTVRATENVHYDVSINWIGDWSFDLMRAEDCEGAQTFTVESQYIDNPDHFVIRVWYRYPETITGYNDGYLEYHFRAEDDLNFDDEKVTLTAEKDHALLNEDVEITVITQGASEIRLYNLDGEFDAAEGDTWIRTTGEEYLYARALIDGTWYTSSPVTIAREYLGDCGSFAYSLGETELLRGDTLHLHIDESEHATWYDVHIMHDGEQVYGDRFEEPGDYELQAFWPEGEYSLYVTAGALGYSWYNDGEQEPENFTITSPADDPGRLTVSKTELITNENFSWTLYAKGADQVALCMTEDPGNLNAEENHWHEQEGDWAEGNWNSFGHEGTYYLFIGGYFANDEGGYWEYVGEPVEIHVTAPNGDVPVPEVGYASLVPANEDYIFTVRAAENVHYDVSVNWIGDWSFDLMRAEDCEGAQTFTVDSQYIDNPDHFVIRVWYWYSGEMTGYNDGYLEYHFRAEDTPNFDDEKVTLTAEKDHALLNEDVEITVTTQGASEIRLYNLDGEFDAAEGDTWIRTTGEEYLYARALIDGTWYTSSPVTIAREYLGECGRVEYSLGETELLRGDTLHLHIDESEHATWYDVHIMHDGEQVYYFRFEEPGDYELRAFWSDGDYCLYVSAGAPGYGWYDDGEQEQGNFTITSPEDDPGRLTVSKTELATNETFSWTLYAKGADQVALCMTEDPSSLHAEENHWHEQEGDWAEGDWNSFGHEGTYYLFIGGYFASDEGGYWDYVGEPVEIHVTAPHGSAPAPEVSFAGIAASNHDYTYTVRAAKDVIYNTSVVREGNWDVELVSDNGCTGEKTLTLGSEVIGDSAYFVIRVWYWYPETITGYNDGYEEYHFFSVSGNAVLVLPKGLSTIEEEAFEGIAAEQVQIPQGVTRIESRAFAACPNLREVKVPASVTYIADDAFEGDLYLVGPSGSYVESFAESHGLLFQADN